MPPLATRVISGRGLAIIDKTSSDFKKAKAVTVYVDVIRKPSQEYLNLNYNPPESRYATLVFLRDEYVVRVEPLKYESQAFDFYPDISAQTLYAQICAYQGILESFANLGAALGVTPVSIINRISEWRHLDLCFDTIKVVCYADAAIQLVVESAPYDLCPDQSNPTPDPPPPPPEPPSLVPPGTPLDENTIPVSPPYTAPDDGGDTEPFEGDAPDPFPDLPLGDDCALYTAACIVRRRNTVNNVITEFAYNFYVRAPIEGYFLQTGSPGAIKFQCRGANQNLGGAPPSCLPESTLVTAVTQLTGQDFLEWVQEPVFTYVSG